MDKALVPRVRRASRPRVKTGCNNCKIRRVKCDEVRPQCNKCVKSGRTCEGYPAYQRHSEEAAVIPIRARSDINSRASKSFPLPSKSDFAANVIGRALVAALLSQPERRQVRKRAHSTLFVPAPAFAFLHRLAETQLDIYRPTTIINVDHLRVFTFICPTDRASFCSVYLAFVVPPGQYAVIELYAPAFAAWERHLIHSHYKNSNKELEDDGSFVYLMEKACRPLFIALESGLHLDKQQQEKMLSLESIFSAWQSAKQVHEVPGPKQITPANIYHRNDESQFTDKSFVPRSEATTRGGLNPEPHSYESSDAIPMRRINGKIEATKGHSASSFTRVGPTTMSDNDFSSPSSVPFGVKRENNYPKVRTKAEEDKMRAFLRDVDLFNQEPGCRDAVPPPAFVFSKAPLSSVRTTDPPFQHRKYLKKDEFPVNDQSIRAGKYSGISNVWGVTRRGCVRLCDYFLILFISSHVIHVIVSLLLQRPLSLNSTYLAWMSLLVSLIDMKFESIALGPEAQAALDLDSTFRTPEYKTVYRGTVSRQLGYIEESTLISNMGGAITSFTIRPVTAYGSPRATPNRVSDIWSRFCELIEEFLISRKLSNIKIVPDGATRLSWKCGCGHQSFDDFQEQVPNAVLDLAKDMVVAGYVSHARVSVVSDGPMHTLRTTVSNAFVGARRRISGLKSTTLPTFSTASSNSSIALQCLPSQTCRWLHMCLKKRPYATKLEPLHVCKDKQSNDYNDATFFQALRNAYYTQRSYKEKLLFKLKKIEFVEFELCPEDLVDHIIPDKLPPTLDEYEFLPPPPLKRCPPIGTEHMMHLFTSCPAQPQHTSLYLRHIPKRRDKALSFRADFLEGNTGWGLHFVEKLNGSFVVTVLFSISLLVGMVFAICWAVLKKDIQGAFGVASYVTSVVTLAVMTWQMWST